MKVNPILLYGIAVGVTLLWYTKRGRAEAARRKEVLGSEEEPRAGQPRSSYASGMLAVWAILTVLLFAFTAWQQHHR